MKSWDELYKELQTKDLDISKDLVELEKNLNKDGISLCVGAGVTISLVGSWTQLLNELAVLRCCDEHRRDNTSVSIDIDAMRSFIYKNVRDKAFLPNSTNTLEQGEYLMYDALDETAEKLDQHDQALSKYWREMFFSAQTYIVVSKSIDRKLKKKTIVDHFIEWEKDHSIKPDIASLASLVELCIKKNVKEIITYNFDTMLDQLLSNEVVWTYFGKKNQQKNVEVYSYPDGKNVGKFCKKKYANRDTIRIYHVHGILDKDLGISPIVFSENSYLEYQECVLNWSNVRIADALIRSPVLCVGFSGTDPNFRYLCRLLKNNASLSQNDRSNQKNEGPNVYLTRVYNQDGYSDVGRFLPRKRNSSGDETNEPIDPTDEKDILCTYYCVKTYLKVVQDYYLHQLGTKVLWAEKYDNIANMIHELANH